MQKSAIALAVAATLAASAVAHAETTFYGSFRMGVGITDLDGVEVEDVNSPGDIVDIFDDTAWDVTNESSRWGVRGSEDLGNGLSAIYQLETKIDADTHNGNDFSGRLAWVGLKGGFGAVKVGAQWSPYYNVAGRTDVFNAVWFNLYQGTFRINDALLYATPDSLAAMKGEIAVVMDGVPAEAATDNFEENIDQYNLGINFAFGPAGVGVGYINDEAKDTDTFAIAASVDFAGASISALYENFEVDSNTDGDLFHVLGQYTFGNNILRAAYGQEDIDGADERDEWALGWQHNLSSRTRLWVEYDDLENAGSELNIGMRHDF